MFLMLHQDYQQLYLKILQHHVDHVNLPVHQKSIKTNRIIIIQKIQFNIYLNIFQNPLGI